MPELHRRDLMTGGAAIAALALLHSARSASAFPTRPGEVVIPWADPPPPFQDPTVLRQLNWEELELLDHAKQQVLPGQPFRVAGDRRRDLEA